MAEDPLTIHARQRVGRVLRGKWTLDRLIGVGGMAAVYAATHRNGSKVAIKLLHPTLMFDTNFAHRLIQEGYVANKIEHPASVKVFDDDSDEADGAVFLVMELLEGMTLSALRRKRKSFEPLEALKLMMPPMEALAVAHQRGIIHRDIKPENLFATKDGMVKILDFGISKMSDGSSMTATRTGMVVGSPAYMSPEQALGKVNAVGSATDVYAIGATLFALLTGSTPHAGESTQEMIVMVATQPARLISTVKPDLNPVIARVIDKSLSYEPANRYPDAGAMLQAVRDAVAEVEGGRALPTFADDDDEGETKVNPAMQPGAMADQADQADAEEKAPEPAAPVLPAAGMNRVGNRPPSGAHKAAGGAPPSPPNKLRPPTMAPTGAPSFGAAFAPQPAAPQAQATPPQPAPLPPTLAPPAHPAQDSPPAQPLAATMAMEMPPGGLPLMPTGQRPVASTTGPQSPPQGFGPQGFGPPGMNPPLDPPGSSSGQRPGVATGMSWSAPPDEVPPVAPSKPRRVGLFAAVGVVGLLAVGGLAASLSGGGSGDNPEPTTAPRPAATPPRTPAGTPPGSSPRATPPGTPPGTALGHGTPESLAPRTPPVAPPNNARPTPPANNPTANTQPPAVRTPPPTTTQTPTPPSTPTPPTTLAHPTPPTPPVVTPPTAPPTARGDDRGGDRERRRPRERRRGTSSNPLGY
ncbi:MAG: protein kinase [Deltaproteobacteria bacterium]|nr:protein kinase [Deltaproteobacteria bacterium]